MPIRSRPCILRRVSRPSRGWMTRSGRDFPCSGDRARPMPRIWVPSTELADSEGAGPTAGAAAPATGAPGTIRLDGEAHRYLSRVLRVAVGATVDVFDGRGHEATTTVERVGP